MGNTDKRFALFIFNKYYLSMVNVGPTGINGDFESFEQFTFNASKFVPETDSPTLVIDQHVAKTGLVSASQLFNFMVQLAHAPNGFNNDHFIGAVKKMRDFRELGRKNEFSPDSEVAMNFITSRNGRIDPWIKAGFKEFPLARILDVLSKVEPWDFRLGAGCPSSVYLIHSLCNCVARNWQKLKPITKDLIIKHGNMSVYLKPDGSVDSAWIGGSGIFKV